MGWPVARSQTQTVPSQLPVTATGFPSRTVHATAETANSCRVRGVDVIRLYAELQDLGYRGAYQRMYSRSMPDIAGSGGSCASTGAWSSN